MTANVSEYIAAGFERLEYHQLDSAGIAAGASGSISTGATGAPAARILGVKTSDIVIPEPDIVPITGDDGPLGQFIFPSTTTPGFNIDIGAQDLQDEAYFQQTLIETQGDMSFGILQPKDQGFPDFALIAVSRAKSKMSGSDGVANYMGIIIPKCQIVPLGRVSWTEREGATYRYRVSTTISDAYPWGKTLTDAVNGTTGGSIMPWSAENRITMHRWSGDGATTAFTLGQTPASSAVAKMRVFVNNTITTGGITISTAAKTLTFSVAPANGAKIVAVYEYTI
jgi:hypothetical protein